MIMIEARKSHPGGEMSPVLRRHTNSRAKLKQGPKMIEEFLQGLSPGHYLITVNDRDLGWYMKDPT